MERRTSRRGTVTYGLDYILPRCHFVPFSGCWIYHDGYLDPYGYGLVGDRNVRVHRLVYELVTGEDLAMLDLHHKCEIKSCCNPEHLQKMTPEEHGIAHERKDPNWCDYGNHPFRKRSSGTGCLTCATIYKAKWRLENGRN